MGHYRAEFLVSGLPTVSLFSMIHGKYRKQEIITTWVLKEEVFFKILLLFCCFVLFGYLEDEDTGLDF